MCCIIESIFIFCVLIVLDEQRLLGIRIKFQESSLFVHHFVHFLLIDRFVYLCNNYYSQEETKVYICAWHICTDTPFVCVYYYCIIMHENFLWS